MLPARPPSSCPEEDRRSRRGPTAVMVPDSTRTVCCVRRTSRSMGRTVACTTATGPSCTDRMVSSSAARRAGPGSGAMAPDSHESAGSATPQISHGSQARGLIMAGRRGTWPNRSYDRRRTDGEPRRAVVLLFLRPKGIEIPRPRGRAPWPGTEPSSPIRGLPLLLPST